MAIELGTAAAAAAISAAINGASWFIFKRSLDAQDAKLRDQDEEIKSLRDEKMKQLCDRFEKHEREAVEARRGIHMRINSVVDEKTFAAHRDEISIAIREMQGDMSHLRQEAAGTSSIVKLIAQHLNISLGQNGRPH